LATSLQGIAQYENLEIKIAMAGVDGAKRDLLTLLGLQERLKRLQDETKLGEDLSKAKALPNMPHAYGTTGVYFGGGIGGDPVLMGAQPNEKELAIAKAENAIRQNTLKTNLAIWKGTVSFGYEENRQRLLAANVDEAAIEKRLALLKATQSVDEAQARVNAGKLKEKENSLKADAKAVRDRVGGTSSTDQQSNFEASIAKAIEWHKKDSEAVKGAYEANKEYEVAMYNHAILLNSGNETQEQYNIGVTKAQQTLDEALSPALTKAAAASFSAAEEAFNLGAGAAKASKSFDKLQEASFMIGNFAQQVFGLNGADVSGAISAYGTLSDPSKLSAYAEKNNMTEAQAQVSMYGQLGQSVGGMVGGKTGNAISGAASGATTGFMLGGPIGAGIGGVIGLVGSLIGSSSAAKQARDDARKAGYNDIIQSALSGGEYSAMLAKGGGYTYDAMAGWNTTVNGRTGSLFNDRAEAGMDGLTKYVAVMDSSLASVAALVKPSIVTRLAEIQTQYEYSVATAGQLAELEQARMADLVIALTGVTADSLSSMLDEVMTSTPTGEAGKAFAEKMESAIATSIRSMAESTFSQNIIMPAIKPLLEELTTALASGGDTSGIYARMKTSLTGLTPAINEFQAMMTELGVAGYSTASGVDAVSVALNYALTTLSDSIKSEKDSLAAAYEINKKLYSEQISLLDELAGKLSTLNDKIAGALNTISANVLSDMQQRVQAQAEISAAALKAKTLGILPLDGQLDRAIGIATKDSRNLYATEVDYKRDMYKTAINLSAIQGATKSQLSDAEKQTTLLEKQTALLDKTYNDQISRLDSLYTAAQEQVNVATGMSTTILSVDDSVAALNSLLENLGVSTVQAAESATLVQEQAAVEINAGVLSAVDAITALQALLSYIGVATIQTGDTAVQAQGETAAQLSGGLVSVMTSVDSLQPLLDGVTVATAQSGDAAVQAQLDSATQVSDGLVSVMTSVDSLQPLLDGVTAATAQSGDAVAQAQLDSATQVSDGLVSVMTSVDSLQPLLDGVTAATAQSGDAAVQAQLDSATQVSDCLVSVMTSVDSLQPLLDSVTAATARSGDAAVQAQLDSATQVSDGLVSVMTSVDSLQPLLDGVTAATVQSGDAAVQAQLDSAAQISNGLLSVTAEIGLLQPSLDGVTAATVQSSEALVQAQSVSTDKVTGGLVNVMGSVVGLQPYLDGLKYSTVTAQEAASLSTIEALGGVTVAYAEGTKIVNDALLGVKSSVVSSQQDSTKAFGIDIATTIARLEEVKKNLLDLGVNSTAATAKSATDQVIAISALNSQSINIGASINTSLANIMASAANTGSVAASITMDGTAKIDASVLKSVTALDVVKNQLSNIGVTAGSITDVLRQANALSLSSNGALAAKLDQLNQTMVDGSVAASTGTATTTTGTVSSMYSGRDLNYLLAKTLQLNQTMVNGRQDWTVAGVSTAMQEAGLTLAQHYQLYGQYEGLPAYANGGNHPGGWR
jgi:hypothetical protein